MEHGADAGGRGGGGGGAVGPSPRRRAVRDARGMADGRRSRGALRGQLLRPLPDRARAGRFVLAAAGLASVPAPISAAALAVVAYMALGSADEGFRWLDNHTPHHRELAIGDYIREHAGPRDTVSVMYARPNIVYYAGRRQPYPYLWSLMVRVRPDARPRLRRLLRRRSGQPGWCAGTTRPAGSSTRTRPRAHTRPRLPTGRNGLQRPRLRSPRRCRPAGRCHRALSLELPSAWRSSSVGLDVVGVVHEPLGLRVEPGELFEGTRRRAVRTCPMRTAMMWSACGSGRTGAAPAGAAVVASAATETATANSLRRCMAGSFRGGRQCP